MKNKPNTSIAFFGTPEFAVYVLEELKVSGIEPDIVVTAPDRPAGRGLQLQASPVKEWAIDADIPTLQPESLKKESDALSLLQNSEWDLFIVAAYGKILPASIINLPRRGVLNVHPSLLPRFRGASPIETQILKDEKETGVSIMLIDKEMDHGPIVAQASIAPEEWPFPARMLEELLAREGGKLLAEAIPPWVSGDIEAVEQEHDKATFTEKIKKEDGEISLDDDAYQNWLKFNAYDGWPGVYFFTDEKRIKITDAEYKNGVFTPLKIVPEGKKEMDYKNLS